MHYGIAALLFERWNTVRGDGRKKNKRNTTWFNVERGGTLADRLVWSWKRSLNELRDHEAVLPVYSPLYFSFRRSTNRFQRGCFYRFRLGLDLIWITNDRQRGASFHLSERSNNRVLRVMETPFWVGKMITFWWMYNRCTWSAYLSSGFDKFLGSWSLVLLEFCLLLMRWCWYFCISLIGISCTIRILILS